MPSSEKTRIGEIQYNPATERFEALVTFEAETGTRRVAAKVSAPITAEFEQVAKGLLNDARRRLREPGALKSRLRPARQHSTPVSQPSGFDWQSLLHGHTAA